MRSLLALVVAPPAATVVGGSSPAFAEGDANSIGNDIRLRVDVRPI